VQPLSAFLEFALNNPHVIDFAMNDGILLAMACRVLYDLWRNTAILVPHEASPAR
jgi:hypothetical protein